MKLCNFHRRTVKQGSPPIPRDFATIVAKNFVRRLFDLATSSFSAIQKGLPLRHDCTEAICGADRGKIVSGKEHLSEGTDNEKFTLEMMTAGSGPLALH